MKLLSKDKTMPKSVFQDAVVAALAAALLLLIPFLAMQIADEMKWTLSDFIAAWILFFGAGFTYKLITRKTDQTIYKTAAGLAVGTALFLVWSNLAVGLIGSEDNPANLMYGGVLFVLFIGTIISRFQPDGMAWALFSTAFAQALVTLIALVADFGYPESPVREILGVNGFFITLWIGSALMFLYCKMSKSNKP